MLKSGDVDLFETVSFDGEFFPPDKVEQRFLGKVTQSPESGVTLAYSIMGSVVPDIDGVLHGVLSTGDLVTLFSHGNSLKSIVAGFVHRTGEAGFWAMCIGAHLPASPTAERFDFTLSGLDELVVPGGTTAQVPHSLEPLLKALMPGGVLQLVTHSEAEWFQHISSVIVSKNAKAIEALECSFQEIKAGTPDNFFAVKKALRFLLRLEYEQPTTLKEALTRAFDLSSLFALLVHTPVHLERFEFEADMGNGFKQTITVFPSQHLDRGTIELAKRPKPFHQVPINLADADLPTLVPAWLSSKAKHQALVSGLQHQTGWRTVQQMQGEFILNATRLEGISKDEGGPKGKKFEYPIETYASGKLRTSLGERLDASDTPGIGVAISNIRNELAHVGKPPVHTAKLTARAFSEATTCLELVVIGYVLRSLGVPKTRVDAYQDIFVPSD
jgi:hypothetical protein